MEESGTELPKYKVLKEENGYEMRNYDASKWVSTSSPWESGEEGRTSLFWKLFRYIQGNNEREAKISMTAPVSTVFKDGQITMCFYIPEEHQEAPPAPTDPEVRVVQRPAMTVYASRFGGHLRSNREWEEKAGELRKSLEQAGVVFNGSYYYTNSYDPPFRLTDRRNEIWFEAEF